MRHRVAAPFRTCYNLRRFPSWLTSPVSATLTRIPSMPTFSSNPLNEARYSKVFRKHPALFGVPFVLLIVGASYGMQQFTQTRYDLHSQKVTAVCTFLNVLQLKPQTDYGRR